MLKFLLSIICFSNLLFGQTLVTYTNYNEAIKEAKSHNKRVLMFMYTDTCSWCKKMKQTTLSDAKTIEFINKNYIFLTMNKEKGIYPQKFNPRFIPTTLLIDPKDEEELYALFGYKTSKELMDELNDDEL